MLKLQRSSFLQALTQNSSFRVLHCNFFSINQFATLPEDIFDPPFSPTSKTLTSNNKKKKKKEKQKKQDIPQEILASSDNHNVPFRSDLPFDFRYSYSETNPKVEPIGFREPPRFSPFGPGRLDRKWDGVAAPIQQQVDPVRILEERNSLLGEPLTEEEIEVLVERYRHSDCDRQINLGKGGVTHNLLDDIHNHWKRAEADKTGGKIIYRNINILLLYRGRNYNPKNRPIIPLMLYKPLAPIYPKLVKNVADGLSFEETKEMRNRGLNTPPLMKLTRNGVYVNVVAMVRDAFETQEVVRLDCSHVGTSDCKKIGVKLRDLVPCIPILFKDEQIIVWRGKKHEPQGEDNLKQQNSNLSNVLN